MRINTNKKYWSQINPTTTIKSHHPQRKTHYQTLIWNHRSLSFFLSLYILSLSINLQTPIPYFSPRYPIQRLQSFPRRDLASRASNAGPRACFRLHHGRERREGPQTRREEESHRRLLRLPNVPHSGARRVGELRRRTVPLQRARLPDEARAASATVGALSAPADVADRLPRRRTHRGPRRAGGVPRRRRGGRRQIQIRLLRSVPSFRWVDSPVLQPVLFVHESLWFYRFFQVSLRFPVTWKHANWKEWIDSPKLSCSFRDMTFILFLLFTLICQLPTQSSS